MADPMPLEHSALLVMDVQQGIAERYGALPILEPLGTAIAAARSAHIPVIYVTIKFREGYPEISPRNRSFSTLRNSGAAASFSTSSSASEVHPAIAPQPGDITVIKRRVSAFTGSDLEVVLRGQEVDTLILTGIATSGVVLSTLRQAADMDYGLGVLSDCCADNDEEVHRVLLTKLFPRQASVMTSAEWIAMLPKK